MNKIVLLGAALAALLLAQSASPPLQTRLALVQINTYTFVLAEAPAAGAIAGTWTLVGVPVGGGAACYRNGLRQAPGNDYMLVGNTITSGFWQIGDTLLCDYAHL